MYKYHVRIPCEVLGVFRHAGETFTLSDEQARLLMPPFGNVVIPAVEIKAETVADADNILDADAHTAAKKEPVNGKLKRG